MKSAPSVSRPLAFGLVTIASLVLASLASATDYVRAGPAGEPPIKRALDRVITNHAPLTYTEGVATGDDEWYALGAGMNGWHLQGIANYKAPDGKGYYYLAHNRPYVGELVQDPTETTASPATQADNKDKLLVMDATSKSIVARMDLSPSSDHPGGIQVYQDILVIPETNHAGTYRNLRFFRLTDPKNPAWIGSLNTNPDGATGLDNPICAGITGDGTHYIVAAGQRSKIHFYKLDLGTATSPSFSQVGATIKWKSASVVNSPLPAGWTTKWRTQYEGMSLIKVQATPTSTPTFNLITYVNDPDNSGDTPAIDGINDADVYGLSFDSSFTAATVSYVTTKSFAPYKSGSPLVARAFRYGAGAFITDSNNLSFYNCNKYFYGNTGSSPANVLSIYNVD